MEKETYIHVKETCKRDYIKATYHIRCNLANEGGILIENFSYKDRMGVRGHGRSLASRERGRGRESLRETERERERGRERGERERERERETFGVFYQT
jgi:hypothetical protein